MGFFETYLLFMISVGIWSAIQLMYPAIEIMKVTDPEDVLVQNKFISYMVMFCIGALVAPFMVVIILTPKLYDIVITTLTTKRD